MSLADFERTMLESGAQDRPSVDRRSAARRALFGAAGVASVGATATVSSGPATPATSSLALTAKIGLCVGIAAIGVGAVWAVSSTWAVVSTPEPKTAAGRSIVAPSTPSPVAPSTPSPVAPSTPSTPASVDTSGSTPTLAVSALPNAAASIAVASTRPPALDPVAAEARLLESARACLAAADSACARTKLAEHSRTFPRPNLGDEATVLAVDVALTDGDRETARRLAGDLLAKDPRGPWAARMRKVMAE